jgi:hypothetical protein
MALPPTHTIDFTGGDALKFAFQIKDKDLDDPEAPPVPRDLTGWTSLAQVRQTATSDEILATWAILPLDATGIVHMKLTGDLTQPLIPLKTVVSDVQLTDPSGDPETVLRITLNVAQDISRE